MKGLFLLPVKPLLLEKRQKTGIKIKLQIVVLRFGVQIENLVILSIPVPVKILVGIVEENAS